MTRVIKYDQPHKLNKADVKPKIKVPARNTRKLGGIRTVTYTGTQNHPDVIRTPVRVADERKRPDNHPDFVTVSKTGTTWFGISKPGTCWVSEDRGASWKPLKVPRAKSENVDQYVGPRSPERTARASWIPATSLPSVAGGERKQHDARLKWAPVTRRTPSR